MIRVRITNPTCATRNYSWIPRGLCLEAGESKVVNFDPFTSCTNGMQLNLLSRDVKLGFVKLTYSVDAPCEVVQIEHLYDNVTKPEPKQPEPVEEPVIEQKQIKAVLDVVPDKQEPAVPMIPQEDLSEATKSQPVDIFGDKSLVDTDEMKVGAPATVVDEVEKAPTKKRTRAKKVQA